MTRTDRDTDTFDGKVRLHIYHFIVKRGRAPTAVEVSRGLRRPLPQIRAAFHRLERGHALVLQVSGEILRAAPFWASPTPFLVEIGKQSWWGSCVWDAMGIPAMLKKSARIVTACGCCGSDMVLQVDGGSLRADSGIIHFEVPARRWYENVVFT